MEKGEKEKKEVKKMTASEQAKITKELRETELQEAFNKIIKICKEYQCTLDCNIIIGAGSIKPNVFLADLQ